MEGRLGIPQHIQKRSESLPRNGITRGKFLLLFGATVFSLSAKINNIRNLVQEGGVRLLPPKLDIIIRNIYREISQTSNILVRDSFFDQDLEYVHRANTIEDIDHAFEKGARVFDIDANAVYQSDPDGRPYEKIYAEHGPIAQKTIFARKINVVIDPNELELTTVEPPTLEELIRHIHSLSTSQRQLAVSIHLKYGVFEEKILQKMIDLLDECNMPAEFITWSEFTDKDKVRTRLRRVLARREDVT